MSEPPRFTANDWPLLGDAIAAVMTVVMLLAWLTALGVAWVHWTARSGLESAVLAVLAAAVVATGVGYLRSLYRLRQRCARLARDGVWWQATVSGIGRGHDPAGTAIGVASRWIVTGTATGADGRRYALHSRPVRRLRDVKDLMARRVWARVDPGDPAAWHVVLPLSAVV